MKMNQVYDVIVIGCGPAGLSAAIYGQRAGLSMIVIEASYVSGGQVQNTYEVDNYPGLPGVSGMELAEKFRVHAEQMGTEFVRAKVTEITEDEGIKIVHTKDKNYKTKAVILAPGATHRMLGVPGEAKLAGMGVSYCATCDGAFFRDKTVAVIGGGDVAVEDAIFLARSCKKVYVVHRRDQLRAAGILQKRLMELENVVMKWDSVVDEILGEDQVEAVKLHNVKTDRAEVCEVDGVFVAVGIQPNSESFRDLVEVDQSGYIMAGEDTKTSHAGIFAAGDVRTKMLRQIITATADGANAITAVQEYLMKL